MEGKTIYNGKYPNVLQTFCITKTAKTVLCNALSTSEAEFWKVTVEMTLN